MVTYRLLVIAAVVLLFSSLANVYSKYYSRLIFINIQKQEKTLDQYEVEWGQLRLELTMLEEQNHLELVAKEELKLIMPLRENIIYIKP